MRGDLFASQERMSQLEQDFRSQNEAIFQHYMMLEKIDAENRACNLVMTNISEKLNSTSAEHLSHDHRKVRDMLSLVSDNDIEFTAKRIGRVCGNGPRPILVTVSDKETRNSIVDNFRSLAEDITGDVRIKKDMNPGVRSGGDCMRSKGD